MPRKIVQITSCQVQDNSFTRNDLMLSALCDDGSLWLIGNRNGEWTRVDDIPQDVEVEEEPAKRRGRQKKD